MKQILFNTEMVRAILQDKKTQTRRPVKSPTGQFLVTWPKVNPDKKIVVQADDPPYDPGDILYVRETFAKLNDEGHVYYEYKADTGDPYPGEWPQEEAKGNPDAPKWKSSRHMPKEAARIFLKVTDIRMERVQDINPEDSIAEGLNVCCDCKEHGGCYLPNVCAYLPNTFKKVWNPIYKSKGYGWDTNCWVWIIEFERCEKQDEN